MTTGKQQYQRRLFPLVEEQFVKRYHREIALGGTIRTLALLGLLTVLHLGALDSHAADSGSKDPRLGSWTLVSAQSSLDPANKLSIQSGHDGPGKGQVHVVMSGEVRIDFTAKGNGHATAVSGNPAFDQVEMRRIDSKQAELTERKNGVVVATVRDKLSNDGKELTVTTVSKGHPDQVTVWMRTGGAKTLRDPVAGEWAQDMSKSRLRQGLVLKIEPSGSDGVRFAGEYSYTARFDGKAYDVKSSRNDTVTLALVDPHTVDAIYKRDSQVSQRDRWVVSADGQQMTVTTSGTLESGQKLAEKLVFKKQ